MRKFFKIFGFSLLGLIFLLVIAMVVVANFVNPNSFKPLISKQVYKATGRTLTFEGDLAWSFFPAVGLKTGKLQLSSPAGFGDQPLFKLDHAKIDIAVLPLLRGKVETSDVELYGVQAHLIKNKEGQGNWEFAAPAREVASDAEKAQGAVGQEEAMDYVVPKLDIRDAVVIWEDMQARQKMEIRNFDLQASNIRQNTPFPIKASFDISGNKPEVRGDATLNTKLCIKPDQRFELTGVKVLANLKGKAVSAFGSTLKAQLTGDFVGSPNSLKTDNLKLRLNDTTATGSIDIRSFTRFTGIGQLHVDQLKVAKIHLTSLQASLNANNGLINIRPIAAKLYQGNFKGSATIDTQPDVPAARAVGDITNINATQLMVDTTGKNFLSGTGEMHFNLATRGLDADSITRSLNGQSRFAFRNGKIMLFDLDALEHIAQLFSKSRKMPTQVGAGKGTDYTALTGSANIRNGVLRNDDFLMLTPKYKVTGQGTINLVTQGIDYRLVAGSATNEESLRYPFKVSGTFKNPKTGLDVAAMGKQLVQKTATQLMEKAQGQIGGLLQNVLG